MGCKTTTHTEEELVKETVKKGGGNLYKKGQQEGKEINESSHIACVSFVVANKREASSRGCGGLGARGYQACKFHQTLITSLHGNYQPEVAEQSILLPHTFVQDSALLTLFLFSHPLSLSPSFFLSSKGRKVKPLHRLNEMCLTSSDV